LGGKNPPEFIWGQENSGGKIPPEDTGSGGKIPPKLPETAVSGGKIPPEQGITVEAKHMETNDLRDGENGSLRVNQSQYQEEAQEGRGEAPQLQGTEDGVATLDHPHPEEASHGEQGGGHADPYNVPVEQEDKSMSPEQIEREAFSTGDFVVRPQRKKPSKPRKEHFPGERSLHAREVRKQKENAKPPQTILNSEVTFIETYHRIVSEETGGRSSFPRPEYIGVEEESVHRVRDILKNNGCFDEDTLIGWMRYAGSQFRKIRKTVTVGMMRSLWDGFNRHRPKSARPVKNSSVPLPPMANKDVIANSMTMIFSRVRGKSPFGSPASRGGWS
jgi:hypothetical protein